MGSSLPLQFQIPSTTTMPNVQQSTFPGSTSSYQTAMGSGVNPFQQQYVPMNPFAQQQYSASVQSSAFAAAGPFTPSLGFINQPQQQYFANEPQMQSPMSAPGTHAQNNFFHPQPQQGAPTAGQALFASGNAQGGSFMSGSASQGQFLSSSPAQQFPSHSPQLLTQTTPQPQMQLLSTTPQPQMARMSTTPQLQMQMGAMGQPSGGQFMSSSPGLGMGMVGGLQQGQFMSTTPQPQMQMQQQGYFGAQPQGQFGSFSGQPFSAGGFTGAQQWGAM
ncbi:hypothetical protein DXG03_009227 [Asterophora parasitica]|uniref:Uncharacterized protein n=1 Tax=Asterophora parasitica TaxID=117018 RepID=A0A9P7G4M3_9AGAR|nr:hypothetical protein DXG03_009227 [Asterophora parasitica]